MLTRYEAEGGSIAGSLARLASRTLPVLYAGWRLLFETAVFGAAAGRPMRWLMARTRRRHLAAIEADFDAVFYLKQIAGTARQRRAAQAPLLHYVLIGSGEGRSPHPAFDVAFYRRHNSTAEAQADPLLHYLMAGARGPRNECEAAVPAPLWRPDRESVLSVHHARGGGSSSYLSKYEDEIRSTGANVMRLRFVPGAVSLGVVEKGDDRDADGEVFDLSAGRRSIIEFARQRHVTRLLVNHVIDWPPDMLDWIGEITAALDCSYDVILHDYFVLCPRVDMVMGSGRFCHVAPPDVCRVCVAAHGSDADAADLFRWRPRHLEFLARAKNVIAVSNDLAVRIQPFLPSRRIRVRVAEDDAGLPAEALPALEAHEPLKVAVLGGLNVPKGVRVLRAVAEQAVARRAPVRFTLIGHSPEAADLRRAKVTVTGAYRAEDLEGLIRQYAPHVIFLPAVWPETWSFVLTSALRQSLPVVAFDIGAPAERLRRLGRGTLLPLDVAERPDDVLAALLQLRHAWGGR
jgi:glycosyltransferase involved in cell wall biosynthesis